jgi:hypothetical protein
MVTNTITFCVATDAAESLLEGYSVEIPSNIDAVLKRLLERSIDGGEQSVLAPEDEAYLNSLISAVRLGRRAVLIVEDADERLRYMFSNATRAEAVTMLGKVVEATGRRLADGDD